MQPQRSFAAEVAEGRKSTNAGAGGADVVLSRAEEKGTADRIRGLPTREEQVERLKAGEMFDVLVVGGGATGSGTALDAQLRGLNTAMIERGDFSGETSSRSTKLIWAGIRYIATSTADLLRWKNILSPLKALQNWAGEIKMVLGAHRERTFLLQTQTHLTNWLPIAVPIEKWISWPPPFGHPIFSIAPMVLPLVMKLYDAMGGFTCPPSHVITKKRAKRKFPQLREDTKYIQIFYEGSIMMHGHA